MKKLIGILVLFVSMSTVNLNANTSITVEEVGVGGCFAVWTFVYDGARAAGASVEAAFDFANIAFNQCVAENR